MLELKGICKTAVWISSTKRLMQSCRKELINLYDSITGSYQLAFNL